MRSKKCLKFKSARITLRITQIRVVFLRSHHFCEHSCAFNDFPITKCLPFFLPNRWEILSEYLVTYSEQRSKQIADKNIIREKVLERTKVYYWFNSKVDNFYVNQI